MKTSFSQLIESLLTGFQLMSKGTRKVFKYLQWMSKTYRNVFPSLESIAKGTGLSVKTVQRAINSFVTMDWLIKIRRPYQSNVYYMPDEIININLEDSEAFFRNVHQCDHQCDQQDDQQNGQVLSTPSNSGCNPCMKESVERLQKENLEQSQTPLMSLPGLTINAMADITMQFDNRLIAETVRRTHWYMSKPGNYIRDMKNWIVKTENNLKKNRL